MAKPNQNANGAGSLVKHALAERLRAEIVAGRIAPGVRIVEGTWGRKFGAAQASVREAINILAHEGFVTKASGRSARVVSLSEQDVLQLFELRGALEGLAARLAAARGADIAQLEHALERMRRASRSGNSDEILDADRQFHLELCDLSGILICNSTRAGYCCRSSHSSVCGWPPPDRARRPGTADSMHTNASSISFANARAT